MTFGIESLRRCAVKCRLAEKKNYFYPHINSSSSIGGLFFVIIIIANIISQISIIPTLSFPWSHGPWVGSCRLCLPTSEKSLPTSEFPPLSTFNWVWHAVLWASCSSFSSSFSSAESFYSPSSSSSLSWPELMWLLVGANGQMAFQLISAAYPTYSLTTVTTASSPSSSKVSSWKMISSLEGFTF